MVGDSAVNRALPGASEPAWPAGSKAYALHLTRLDRWITSIGRGAVLSKKVIQVANIAMIAPAIGEPKPLASQLAGANSAPDGPETLSRRKGVGSGCSQPPGCGCRTIQGGTMPCISDSTIG